MSRKRSQPNRYRSQPMERLQARNRKATARGQHPVLGGILLVALTLAVVGAVGYAGLLLLRNALFAENDRFQIKTIEVQPGAVKTEPIIREYLEYVGVAPGVNLFSFPIRELADLYLERNPLVRSVQVQRVFPDTLRFGVLERRPLARIGQRSSLVVDREGFVFRLRTDLHRLPVIMGAKYGELSPGDFVQGMMRAALEVIEVCDNPRVGLRIMGVDVAQDDYLLIHVLTSDGIKEARLSWVDMGSQSEASRQDLLLRLARLRQVAQQDRSGRTQFDATLPGRIFVR